MKIIIYLLIASVIIIALMTGFSFVSTVIEINTMSNRVEDSLIAAGWAGFSKADLDLLAVRKDIANEEQRDVYLDKTAAISAVTEYIKKNLKLDASLKAKPESYIQNKTVPIMINEISIFNPDEVPAVCSRGTSINKTTIHIMISIPMDIKWLGFRYGEKHVDVDAKSFLKEG